MEIICASVHTRDNNNYQVSSHLAFVIIISIYVLIRTFERCLQSIRMIISTCCLCCLHRSLRYNYSNAITTLSTSNFPAHSNAGWDAKHSTCIMHQHIRYQRRHIPSDIFYQQCKELLIAGSVAQHSEPVSVLGPSEVCGDWLEVSWKHSSRAWSSQRALSWQLWPRLRSSTPCVARNRNISKTLRLSSLHCADSGLDTFSAAQSSVVSGKVQ